MTSTRKDAYFTLTQFIMPSAVPGESKSFFDARSAEIAAMPAKYGTMMSQRIRMFPNDRLAKLNPNLGFRLPDPKAREHWVLMKVESVEQAFEYWADEATDTALGLKELNPEGLILVAEPKISIDRPDAVGAGPRTYGLLLVTAPAECDLDKFSRSMDQFFEDAVKIPVCEKNFVKHTMLNPILPVPASIRPNFRHPGPEVAIALTETPTLEAFIEIFENPDVKAFFAKNLAEPFPGLKATFYCMDVETNFKS
ncbi:hypothetical protein HMN09_00943700 [Mycena chlorophos]|uniref:Uncharacterized protein n=1 Tax=Mycena chlorophos TaxID=658473 RepID=A0A8H6W0K5_MYCCL|nr:hypothetical protein HMN09_00943700 [Mycena chlorophos]